MKRALIAAALALACAVAWADSFTGQIPNLPSFGREGFPAASDAVPPVPGNSGTITTASVAATTLTLNWTAATDAVTAQASLQYRVYKSASNNIDTPANAVANGTALNSYTANIATYDVTGLTASTTYYFNVLVKDAAQNVAAYTTKSQATAAGSFSDNFDRADGALGANWLAQTSVTDPSSAFGQAPAIVSNEVTSTNTAGGWNHATVAASGFPTSADYYVQADFLVSASGANDGAALVLRYVANNFSDTNQYILEYSGGWGGMELRRRKESSFANLGFYAGARDGAYHTLKLEAIGTTINAYFDGVKQITVTDSGLSATGHGGFQIMDANAHVDNFSLGAAP